MDTEAKDNAEKSSEEDYPFHQFLRRLMLAGIGVLSYSQEEFEQFMDKMVERGEVTHKDHEAQMKKMRERRMNFFRDRKGYANKRVKQALDEFDVPTKKDIEDMTAKIAALEKQIDELKKTPG